MTTPQHAAYTTHQREGETLRETEAHALLSCASKLDAARQSGVSREDFGAAVRHNQQLWTIFQVALCEPDNALPRELKTTLLNLSRYVDKVSFQAISQDNPSLLRSLISINRNIAAGLAKKPQGAQLAPNAAVSAQTFPDTGVLTSA